MSSPSTLKKLPLRVSCGAPTLDPNMLTPLPKDSGETFDMRALKGVLGLPNSCVGRATLLRAEGGAGEEAIITCAFFEGVSGIFVFPYNEVVGISMLRLRLEIKPVDMNACGSGLAIL